MLHRLVSHDPSSILLLIIFKSYLTEFISEMRTKKKLMNSSKGSTPDLN